MPGWGGRGFGGEKARLKDETKLERCCGECYLDDACREGELDFLLSSNTLLLQDNTRRLRCKRHIYAINDKARALELTNAPTGVCDP
jgi:hypothetical protein